MTSSYPPWLQHPTRFSSPPIYHHRHTHTPEKHPTAMPRTLEPVTMDEATDWTGHIISRQTAHHLTPDCIVRVVVKNYASGAAEAVYFQITKIKDGTFWGVAQDTYRLFDVIGLREGDQMTFRREHLNEIPLAWQPRRFQKAVAYLEPRRKGYGYGITGIRGVGT